MPPANSSGRRGLRGRHGSLFERLGRTIGCSTVRWARGGARIACRATAEARLDGNCRRPGSTDRPTKCIPYGVWPTWKGPAAGLTGEDDLRCHRARPSGADMLRKAVPRRWPGRALATARRPDHRTPARPHARGLLPTRCSLLALMIPLWRTSRCPLRRLILTSPVPPARTRPDHEPLPRIAALVRPLQRSR